MNRNSTTPSSDDMQDRFRVGDQPEAERPDGEPGGQIAEHRAEPRRLKIGTAMTPAASSATTCIRSTPLGRRLACVR